MRNKKTLCCSHFFDNIMYTMVYKIRKIELGDESTATIFSRTTDRKITASFKRFERNALFNILY